MKRFVNWLIAKYFIDAVKQIEKKNWMTSVLKICFKQQMVKDNWLNFLTGVERLLLDAKDEIQSARRWK